MTLPVIGKNKLLEKPREVLKVLKVFPKRSDDYLSMIIPVTRFRKLSFSAISDTGNIIYKFKVLKNDQFSRENLEYTV